MHNIINKIKKVFPILLCISVLTGCHTKTVNMKTHDIVYDKDYISVNAKIPVFSGLDKAFAEFLNDNTMKKYEKYISDFDADALSVHDGGNGPKFELNIEPVLTCNKKFLSYIMVTDSFSGGTHKLTAKAATTVDLSSNSPIFISDMFTDGTDYASILTEYMQNLAETDFKTYNDLWEAPSFTAQQNEDFYIQDDKIIIFYPPYDLAPYSAGFIEFPIPLSDINEYLKPEYQSLTSK